MARVDEQIRRARRESGLSQEALAERIGVPPADLHRFEEGAQISSRHLELIAVATGKPVSFFLHGTGAGSQNGRGLGDRVRAALAWLSEPTGSEQDERERALAGRERRLAQRERALASRREVEVQVVVSEVQVLRQELARQQDLNQRLVRATETARSDADRAAGSELRTREEASAVLAALESELEAKAKLLEERTRAIDAREAELTRLQAELEQRASARQAPLEPVTGLPTDPGPTVAATPGLSLDALEHKLDERAGEFPERIEEWRAYVVFLREFVHADGVLPPTFNTLVREVFRELLA